MHVDKKKTKMKIKCLTFYPLHVNVMNVSRELEKYFVENSKTVMAYLPVYYYDLHAEDMVLPYLEVENIDRMKALNNAIEAVMKSVAEAAYKRLSCRTSDEHYVRLNFAIVAYCVDSLEVKDMISITYRHRMTKPCMRCHINSDKVLLEWNELCRNNE